MMGGRGRKVLVASLGALSIVACGLSTTGLLQEAPPEAGAPLDGASDQSTIDAVGTPDVSRADADQEPSGDGAFDVRAEAGVDAVAEVGVDAAADAAVDSSDAACPCGVQQVCSNGVCIAARRVFLSSFQHDGNLGGAAAADSTVCGIRAMDANLGGAWAAWVSDNTSSVASRFTHSTVGYYLLDGTEVAANWAGLTSGSLLHPIDEDAYAMRHSGVTVWTGTQTDGSMLVANCNGFGSNAMNVSGAYGDNTRTDGAWTNEGTVGCDNSFYIYCFEQ